MEKKLGLGKAAMSNENLTSESFWHDGYETSFNLIKTV